MASVVPPQHDEKRYVKQEIRIIHPSFRGQTHGKGIVKPEKRGTDTGIQRYSPCSLLVSYESPRLCA
jgi:hypothetical protein